MTARDDYPLTAREAEQEFLEAAEMLDEIDQLRRWKAEGIEVLTAWENAFNAVSAWFPRLGANKSDCVLEYILWLEGAVKK